MDYLLNILVVLQIVSAIGMVTFIMLQQGKGADMGASFGSGASGSLFGASGSSNFLSRTTAILATVFFLSTLGQAFLSGSVKQFVKEPSSVLQTQTTPSTTAEPGSVNTATAATPSDTANTKDVPTTPVVPAGK